MPDPQTATQIEWHAELLRMTAFPTPTAKAARPEWWQELTGETPRQVTSEPRKGGAQVEGTFADGRLLLTANPMRIDLAYLVTPNVTPFERERTLGSYARAESVFANVASKWLGLESRPPIQRLAYGVVVVAPVDSHEEGYQALQTFLPAVRLDPASSDFLYQINRTRQSAIVEGLTVNRLSKWLVQVSQGIGLVPPAVETQRRLR